MSKHSSITMRRFVFGAMAVLGAVHYSFVGDKIYYMTATGKETETTTAALKADQFDKGFDSPHVYKGPSLKV